MASFILPPRAKNLTGRRFGRLVAINPLPPLHKADGCRWECVCDCGKSCIVKARFLTYKRGTRSCGCIVADLNRAKPKHRPSTNLRHGHASRKASPEYICWSSMIQRCTNPKHASYKNYGGRGVSVCERWASSFDSFISDMGRKPSSSHSIDRLDGNLGYTPENCRWATPSQQANNRRGNVRLKLHGVEMLVIEAARQYGIPERTLYRWVRDGKDVELAINLREAKRQSIVAH